MSKSVLLSLSLVVSSVQFAQAATALEGKHKARSIYSSSDSPATLEGSVSNSQFEQPEKLVGQQSALSNKAQLSAHSVRPADCDRKLELRTSAATKIGGGKAPAPSGETPGTRKIQDLTAGLVAVHCATNPECLKIERQFTTYRNKLIRTTIATEDALNHSFGFKGCDPSQKAANIVIDEKAQIHDYVTAEYERQKVTDATHQQVISCLAQISMGLGSPQGKDAFDSGYRDLNKLVGAAEADEAVKALIHLYRTEGRSSAAFAQPTWDTLEREEKLQTLLRVATENDPIIKELRARLDRYAHPGAVKSATSKTMGITLSTAALLSPGLAIPLIAEGALDSFFMATGGTEESKLEKELVYNKRIDNRLRLLTGEATLAVDNYRFAQVTHNVPLLIFSQKLMDELSR